MNYSRVRITVEKPNGGLSRNDGRKSTHQQESKFILDLSFLIPIGWVVALPIIILTLVWLRT